MNNVIQQRNPVLLVHGIFDTGRVFHRMVPYLKQKGLTVYDLDLVPNNGNAALDQLAEQVANYINATFSPEQTLDLVGFSMGGIVSRYYVQRLGGINRVQRFITLSAPNHGTWLAYFHHGLGSVQMRPNSALLQDLNRHASMLDQIHFTSIWTPYDLMILPANSSQMPVGQNVIVPVLTHARMLTDSRSLVAVEAALRPSGEVNASASLSNPQPTTHNPQPTTHNPQPTTNNPQPTTHNPQLTTHNPQPTTNNPQPTTHNPQPTTNN